MSQYKALDTVWSDIKRCYRCGYCREMIRDLTGTYRTCPVREVRRQECYTARGRNTIARGLCEGRLQLSRGLRDLVYTCLGCGGCKEVCSLIDWAKIDTPAITRAMRRELHLRRLTPRVVRNVLKVKATQLAAPAEASCRKACPLGQDIPAYLDCIAAGRFAEAAAVIRRDNPLPSICGRACAHPCEAACRQGEIGQPLNIMRLKRFCMDWEAGHGSVETIPAPTIGPVAVVGSGPAGLAAADRLIRNGVKVTVLERATRPGGMLSLAIPDFTLPMSAVDRDIQRLRDAGVEFRTSVNIDSTLNVPALLEQGFKAVLLCCGAWKALRPELPGNQRGSYDGLGFLAEVKSGKLDRLSGKALVIGGGETAVDVARTAVRLGAEVTILYRRSREEMPVATESLKLLLDEGVRLEEGRLPVEILGKEHVEGLRTRAVRYMEPAEDGSVQPVYDEGQDCVFPADMIIWAVGQEVETPEWRGALEVKTGRGGRVTVDADGRLGAALVFAAGDMVSGPSSIAEAMASGRRVASAALKALGVEETPNQPVAVNGAQQAGGNPAALDDRAPMQLRPLNGFAEREDGFTEEQARAEASRCLRCDRRGACASGVKADTLFFSGCNGRYRLPGAAEAAKDILRRGGIAFVEGEEVCCGSPAVWSGDLELAEALRVRNMDMFHKLGIKKIITVCADCQAVLARDYKLAEAGIEVEHFVTTLGRLVKEGAVHLKPLNAKVTYHDPCQLARESGGTEAPREVLASIKGLTVAEMLCHGRSTQCCGGGPNGLVSLCDPDLAAQATRSRLEQAKATGADTVITACSWCRIRLGKQADDSMKVMDFPEFIRDVVGLE